MEVKDIFELRKQGRIEEAYEAIRPMYAAHKGKYTTLAMFWTASDILKKRLTEKRTTEAMKIMESLLRVLPSIDDKDGKCHAAIIHHALRLSEEVPAYSVLQFIKTFGVEHLTDSDWQAVTPQPKEGEDDGKKTFPLPSPAQRMLTRAFHELRQHPTTDNALIATPLLHEALRRQPRNKNNQRFMAVVYTIMGERDKAIAIYKQLLARSHDSWLYAELAQLTTEEGPRAALLCQAIMQQRQAQFRSGYHLQLAQMLAKRDKPRALYELQQCIAIRQAQGHPLTRDINTLQAELEGIQPANRASQYDFYRRMAEKYPI